MATQINKTNAATDRTKASVVSNSDTGTKNIVMKGPLAEIITKSLNELYKFEQGGTAINEHASESLDQFGLTINGKRVFVEKQDKGQIIFYAIYRSMVNTSDLIDFKDLLSEKKETDELVLGCVTDTEEQCPAAEVLVSFANNNGITVYDSLDLFFNQLLDKKQSEDESIEEVKEKKPESVNLSTEALDQNKKTKTVKGRPAKIAKVAKQNPKAFIHEANDSLNQIEELAQAVKAQSKIYNEWSIKAAHALAQALPEDYEKISEEILSKRPKSPAELVRDRELDWPGLGQFHLTQTNTNTQDEPVFTVPVIASDENEEVQITELDKEDRSLLEKLQAKASNLYQDIASYIKNDKTEEELQALSDQVKEKAAASQSKNKARFYTHPKVVESTGNEFLKNAMDYLNIMGKYFTTAIFSE